MYFEQFYLGCLSHASYLLASGGIAVVVDPQRDVDIYLQAAAERQAKIAHIVETHLHADFVSGHRELAERTAAKIYISAKANAGFPHVSVEDGFELPFGNCRLRVLATPGHTEESICLAIFDPEKTPQPWAVLTGDTLFIGDVGRPDLSPNHTPQELAGMLYDSLHQKLLTLPDQTLVYPAHGAGSLCGRNLRADRFSTIGTERLTNAALQVQPRERFVQELTGNLPARPAYFLEDAAINRQGAEALESLPEPPGFAAPEFAALEDIFLLDTRAPDEYACSHVPGSVCIPLSGQFASWAGALIGLHQPVALIAVSREKMLEARMRLARVGIENVVGWLAGGMEAWQAAELRAGTLRQIGVSELHSLIRQGSTDILDVRRAGEWKCGHIEGAQWFPLDQFPLGGPELSGAKLLAVHCKSGYRSTIACGFLMRAGACNVANVIGGFDAWAEAGMPVATNEMASTA